MDDFKILAREKLSELLDDVFERIEYLEYSSSEGEYIVISKGEDSGGRILRGRR